MPRTNDRTLLMRGTGPLTDDIAQDLLAALVHSSADAVVIETLDGIVTYWNPAAERLYGYMAAEILGQPLTMLIPPSRLNEAEAILRQVRRGTPVVNLETERWTKDRRRIDVSLSVFPVRNDAGEIVATSVIVRDITARKATDQASAASEALLQVAFENAAIGMIMTDPEGRILRVNQALCQMLGYAGDDLRATLSWVLTHPEDRELNRAFTAHALAGELRSYELEQRYLHRDGHIVWGKLNVSLARDAAGSPQYVISQIQNITRSKAAEAERTQLTEELRVSEARYRVLVEQLPGAVYLLANDAHQTPLYFSSRIEQITGETPEEAIAFHRRWLELVHPEDREQVAAADARHGVETNLFRVEYRHRHTDGNYVWVRDECVPVSDEAGQIVAWQGVMLDITDRIQATQAQAQLAAMVESAKDAIVSKALDGTIASWNRGAEQLYGYRAEEIIGQPFRRLLPEDLVAPEFEQIRMAVTSGHATAPFETTRRRKDGTTFAASVSLSPIQDHTGVITGISSITRDITQRKHAEAVLQQALTEAEAANAAKSQFLAMMSHELRTPLQAVLGYAEFLLADPTAALTVEQRDDLGYIQQGGQRMLTLINQLLDLSRLEAGRLDVAREPVDLAEVLEQVRQDVVPQANAKGLALQIDLPHDLPPVIGDPERLRQILLNLVGNAVKFTEQGSVAIAAEAADAAVTVTVVDTGIGIAPDALPQIFEAFRQVESRLARRHGGAGLGLAIAQKLAALMDGQLTVHSELSVGSTFTLALPIATGSATSARGRAMR